MKSATSTATYQPRRLRRTHSWPRPASHSCSSRRTATHIRLLSCRASPSPRSLTRPPRSGSSHDNCRSGRTGRAQIARQEAQKSYLVFLVNRFYFC
ncbi:hypothetical protein ACFPRL_24765 [Pseudoclavibacter helvolus]